MLYWLVSLLVTKAWQTMSSPQRLLYLGLYFQWTETMVIKLDFVKYFEMYMKRTTVFSKLV